MQVRFPVKYVEFLNEASVLRPRFPASSCPATAFMTTRSRKHETPDDNPPMKRSPISYDRKTTVESL
ncbi:hypothetical protein E2C01_014001 [Portunus trituberculatus]|uniref:Uncharacterized protein n=1 Tax=Portunus trituberculatus TaxID=210409 RepID=A0A5B7DIK6_PORTR|nr:hypothetical protein [Portunus trituberculatus]